MTLRRVAITGMGAITGHGHDLKTVWEKVCAGKSAISNIENIDASDLNVRFGGEVKGFALSEEILPAKESTRYDLFTQYALHSSLEALKDAGLLEQKEYDPEKMGCLLGVGMGGFPIIEEGHRTYFEKGARRISPFFIPSIIPNMASGLTSIRFNLQGINYTIASACASAAHAISAASYEIMTGRQDVMVTGGSESALVHLPYAGFINMKALSKRNEEPTKASRPFDKDRDGFVMGEGAGVLILEDLERAKARGAKIYAEVVGHGASSDAHHITAPHPEGTGASKCMKMALDSAGIAAEAVGHINAHGTSTPLGDIAEMEAVKKTFGDHAKNILVTSTKSMTGHLLGAAGGVESIFCAKALHEGLLPPTINLDSQDEKCDLQVVANTAKKVDIEYALNNSFGFGGTNSCLILKKHS